MFLVVANSNKLDIDVVILEGAKLVVVRMRNKRQALLIISAVSAE